MPRTRSRGPTSLSVTSKGGPISIPSLPWPEGGEYQTVVSYDFETMTDNPTPGFQRKRNSGSIIVSDMNSYKESMQLTPCSYRIYNASNGGGYAILNHDGGTAGGIPTDVSAQQGRTRERLRAAASVAALAMVAEPDVESLVSVAEARQTLSTLGGPFAKAIALARGYRRYVDLCDEVIRRYYERLYRWEKRNPKYRGDPPVLKLPKWTVGKFTAYDIPSAWLALRYGLMPIYYDINGIMEAAQRKFDGPPVRQTYRANRRESDRFSNDRSFGGSLGEVYVTETTGDWLVLVRAGCIAEFKPSPNLTWGTHWSLVPSAAWEMVTLSFAVDWIINVGDYLKALTVSARAEIKGSWAIAETSTEMRTTTRAQSVPPGIVLEINPVPVRTYKIKSKERGSDIGQHIKVTRDVNMNLKRFADLASLFALLIKRK